MKKLDMQTISFYEFTCEDSLTDRILSMVSKEQFKHNISNEVSKDDLLFDGELFDWFDKCLEEARKDIGLPDSISLPITSCWVNKTKKYQAHHHHNHPNSFLSAVFYLTNHDSAATTFICDNYWMKDFPGIKFLQPIKKHSTKIYPKKSTLVLFPSWVFHSVAGLITDEIRYTISFNTFLSGEIHDGLHASRLSINATSVRDLKESK